MRWWKWQLMIGFPADFLVRFLQAIWKSVSVSQQKIGSRHSCTLTQSVVQHTAASHVGCHRPWEPSIAKTRSRLHVACVLMQRFMSWERALQRRALTMQSLSHNKTLWLRRLVFTNCSAVCLSAKCQPCWRLELSFSQLCYCNDCCAYD